MSLDDVPPERIAESARDIQALLTEHGVSADLGLIFGLILVLMMLFRPEGLIPSARRRAEFKESEGEASLYDVAH